MRTELNIETDKRDSRVQINVDWFGDEIGDIDIIGYNNRELTSLRPWMRGVVENYFYEMIIDGHIAEIYEDAQRQAESLQEEYERWI